jgi:hypothetical protein
MIGPNPANVWLWRGAEFVESEFGPEPAAHFCDGLVYFGHPSGGDDERVLA